MLFLVGLQPNAEREDSYRIRCSRQDIPVRLHATLDAMRSLGVVRQVDDSSGRDAVVELADDALLSEWQRIPAIVAQNVAFVRWRERLRAAHGKWTRTAAEHRGSALLTGPLLEESEGWLSKNEGNLSGFEQRFIRTSSAADKALVGGGGPSRVFIVRPFNVKEGINFETVEELLIQPALKAAGLEGATTANIAQAGNIREDMFRLLVTADLVIADVSIHNANVFYELGVRHGLRPRGTLLIRAAVDDYPFDLQTDRFLLYDPAKPEASVAKLTAAITATLGTVRTASGTDSPVYKMLPSLPEPSPTALRVVPQDFREAVDYAAAKKEYGDLRLLAHEAAWFEWASEGLRTVGRAQFGLGAWPGARETFESLRKLLPKDVEANQRLGTIYQKLGDLDLLEPGDPARHRCAGRIDLRPGRGLRAAGPRTPRRGGWRSWAGCRAWTHRRRRCAPPS